jgi:photosystem II stability/assembly factor-like uncharacterized protein
MSRRPVGMMLAAFWLWGAGQAAAGPGVWTPIGPNGGTVNGLAVQPGDDKTIYAATVGELYKTRDGGTTWTSVGPQFDGARIATVAVGPAGTLLASDVSAEDFGTIWRSIDAGTTWQSLSQFNKVTQFAFDPLAQGTVYAAGQGLVKSTDGGATWTEIGSGFEAKVAVSPRQSGLVLAGGRNRIERINYFERSTDGGATWQWMTSSCDLQALLFDPVRPARVYAGCGRFSQTSTAHLLVSVDRGLSWKPAVTGLGNLGVYALAALPGAPGTVYAGTDGGGIYRTIDAGAHWTPVPSPVPNAVVGVLAFTSGPQPTLFAGTGLDLTPIEYDDFGEGVFRSDDLGSSWTAASQGMHALPAWFLVADPAGGGSLFAYTVRDLLHTRDGGTHWLPVERGLERYTFLSALVAGATRPATLYAATGANQVFASRNAGRTWAPRTSPPNTVTQMYNALEIDPRDPTHVLFGNGNAVFESHDGAVTWGPAATLPSVVDDPIVTAFGSSIVSPLTVYATATSAYSLPNTLQHALFKSMDGGTTWRALAPPGAYLAVAVDPADAGVVYVGPDFYAAFPLPPLKSSDGGTTWTQLLPGDYPYEVAIVTNLITAPGLPGFVCATIQLGLSPVNLVLLSQDHGATWTQLSSGLPPAAVATALAFDPASSPAHWTLYMGTYSTGIFSFTSPLPPS